MVLDSVSEEGRWASSRGGFAGAVRPRHPPVASLPASTSRMTFRCCRRGRRRASSSTPGDSRSAGQVDAPRAWSWQELQGAAGRGRDGRHPLRHQVVEARHGVEGRLRRHPARRTSRPAAAFVVAHSYGGYTTNLPLDGPDRRQGMDRLRVTTASHSTPSTAARPACSSRTCTSGRARSGSAASSCATDRRARLLGGLRLPQLR